MPKISAIIVAGGTSRRMEGIDKTLLPLGGIPVIERTVAAFERNALINEIVVVTARQNIEPVAQLCARYPKARHIVEGGRTRGDSVQCGIVHCAHDTQFYCIHDAARPFVGDALITAAIQSAVKHGAAIPALPVVDTIKEAQEGMVRGTPDRRILYSVQTPQVFEAEAYRRVSQRQQDPFDDSQLFEAGGLPVAIVPGEYDNIKITRPEDIVRARQIAGESDMRVGQGYDVHRLVEGRKLVLGGVEIAHESGLLGHSDADVLCHAVIDALLGAAALGDIGGMFPDSDAKYKNISSIKLLAAAAQRLREAGYAICNIDATVICEAPKLAPHIEHMRAEIAKASGVAADAVSIKATTEEGLGFTGAMEGISANAVALVQKQFKN